MKIYYYISESYNPYFNLATEKWMLEYAKTTDAIMLFFWKNDNCVVLGRNQNIYEECDLLELQKNNVLPVRRETGGGAVYHNLDNLNYSIISKTHYASKERCMELITKALMQSGINASINGRNDIEIDNKKISGNAFLKSEDVLLHHGTLLFKVNYDILGKCLKSNDEKLKKHGVASVNARVMGIKEKYPLVEEKKVINNITQCFIDYYSQDAERIEIDLNIINKHYEKYKSNDWILGHNSNGVKCVGKTFDWGYCSIWFDSINNKYYFYTDSMDTRLVDIFYRLIDDGVSKETELLGNDKVTNDLNELISRSIKDE